MTSTIVHRLPIPVTVPFELYQPVQINGYVGMVTGIMKDRRQAESVAACLVLGCDPPSPGVLLEVTFP